MIKGWRIILGFVFCVLGFFLDSVLRGVLFACSMATTGVFLGFHSFSRLLKRFLGVQFAFHRFFLALNDFVLFLPFLDVFPATCIHVITSGMDGSVLFAVVFIVHRLC